MFHDLRIISCLLLSFLAVPEEGTYTIEIPRSIDLRQEDSFEIRIKENGLSDNEVLHITMPDSFELNDVESHDTICGQIENNSFDVCKDDYSSRTVNCLIDEIPIGDWHGRIDIRMDLEKTIATNLLICGPQLNNILRQIEPLSIEFNGDPFPEAEEYFDVSAAQDDSIRLYVNEGIAIITNASTKKIDTDPDMSDTFKELSSLTSIYGLDHLDLSGCHDLGNMFAGDHLLNTIDGIGNIDTSSAEDLSYMFYETSSLNSLDPSDWNTASFSNVSHMFQGCKVSSLDVSTWNTANIKDMSFLFAGCTELVSLKVSNWDVSNVEDLSSAFSRCDKLKNLSLSSWDVSSCTSMREMFDHCLALTSIGDLSSWNTGSSEFLSGMFRSCAKLKNVGDLSNWNTASVQDMSEMFSGCSRLSVFGDIGGWDVSNVGNFSAMFANMTSLNEPPDLSTWNVSDNCHDLSYLFQNSTDGLPAELDLSGWDVSSVTNMSHMFENANTLQTLNISGWDTEKLEDASYMFAYTEQNSLSHLNSITGIDAIDTVSLRDISHIFYEDQFLNCDLSSWNTQNLQNIAYAFYGAYRFDIGKTKHWNVSSVSDMTEAFGDSAGILAQSPIPEWYTQ